jgi:uncharacterized protein (UPF0276 family)
MWQPTSTPAVGAAYCAYIPAFVEAHPTALDFVEVPFELLCHDPSVLALRNRIPLVLHCASLSIASQSLCPQSIVQKVQEWTQCTETPWIGEHLAFITSDREEAGDIADDYAPGEPYNIGYTVSPSMDSGTAGRICRHLQYYSNLFSVPILIENSPLYFSYPTSTMSQAEFMSRILDECPCGLLLDLAHLAISAQTVGFRADDEVERYPLERTTEIHISGIDQQPDGAWDNHAIRAPEEIYSLLDRALKRARPKAITMEYNWSARFPEQVLDEDVARIRAIIASQLA